jgi:flavorubredoxin
MSGNTKRIADLIAEGTREQDVEASVIDVRDVTRESLENADAVGFGCPTYEQKLLRPMEKYLDSLQDDSLRDKPGVAFGSYGWSGEAPIMIAEKLREMGVRVVDPVLRIQYAPDEKEAESCRLLGKDIALMIKKAKKKYRVS